MDGLQIGPGGVTLLGASGGITSTLLIGEYDGLVAGATDATRLEFGAVRAEVDLALAASASTPR